jgi:hypothetical protein
MGRRWNDLAALSAVAVAVVVSGVVAVGWFTRVKSDVDSIITAMVEFQPGDRIIEAIEAHGDPDAFSELHQSSLLNAAVRMRRSDVVDWLLTKNADPNPRGEHPLYWAMINDDVRTARKLLGAGARWSALQNDGITIEQWAIEHRPLLHKALKEGPATAATLTTKGTGL